MNELTGWVLGHKEEQKQQQDEQNKILLQQQQQQQQQKQQNQGRKKPHRKSPAYRNFNTPSYEANLQKYNRLVIDYYLIWVTISCM